MTEAERYRGALLGLACGDAVGTTVEFRPRGTFPPLTDMVGGGPFDLPPGAWTDDTSMALCLAHSLLHARGFDARDQMNRFCNWHEHGYLSSTGACFDIGNTVADALRRFRAGGDSFSGSTDPRSAGNGSIMRLAPVPMYYGLDRERAIHFSGESARTTHGAPEAVECTRLFGAQLCAAFAGADRDEILRGAGFRPQVGTVAELADGAFLQKSEDEIRGSGYVLHSLEAALWCFAHTASYEEAVLRAANLGDDADTTAAICGQLAGAFYGVEAIPRRWRDRLVMGAEIDALALRLLAERPPPCTVRRLGTDEWPLYRELRLRALADSPDAFGATLEASRAKPDAEWRARLASGAASAGELALVAESEGEAVGLVWGTINTADPATAHVTQMWVDPARRGLGCGALLLGAVVEWARAAGARAVELCVTRGNAPAEGLYERAGFVPFGEPAPLRPGSPVLSRSMRLEL